MWGKVHRRKIKWKRGKEEGELADRLTQGGERGRESWLLGRTKAPRSGRKCGRVCNVASHVLQEETGWEVSDPWPCWYGYKGRRRKVAVALLQLCVCCGAAWIHMYDEQLRTGPMSGLWLCTTAVAGVSYWRWGILSLKLSTDLQPFQNKKVRKVLDYFFCFVYYHNCP